MPTPGYVPPVLPHPSPVLAVVDPELLTFPCACLFPNGTSCTFIGKDAKQLATRAEISLHFVSTGWSGRYQRLSLVLSIFSEVSSVRHHITGSWSLWQTPRLIHGWQYDLISATLPAQILHPRLHRFGSVFMNAWALGAPPSQVVRRRMSEQKGDADIEQLSRL